MAIICMTSGAVDTKNFVLNDKVHHLLLLSRFFHIAVPDLVDINQ